MKFLITGGCGFLGSNIAESVLKLEGTKLCILDNLSRLGSEKNLAWIQTKGEFDFFKTDIRNTEDVYQIIKDFQPDVIYHLAGQVAMTTSLANPRMDFEINVGGTINILEAVRNFSPHSGVIYSSTNKVYGDLEWTTYTENATRYVANEFPNGFSEHVQLDFHSPYGVSKGSADQYCLDYSRMYGLKTAVFRHSSMYGGRQFSTYDQGWIGWFCSQAILQKNDSLAEPFTISGNGKQVRDVLFSTDMVDLYLAAGQKMDAVNGQAFNIGGGFNNSLSLLELLAHLNELTGTQLRFIKLPTRSSDQKVFIADLSKITAYTSWTPKVDALTGLKNMIEWLEQGHAN